MPPGSVVGATETNPTFVPKVRAIKLPAFL